MILSRITRYFILKCIYQASRLINHVYVCKHIQPYICQLNCDVRVWHGKIRDFIIDRTIYWVRLFEVSVFEWNIFFLLRNIMQIDGIFKSVRAIHGIRSIRVRGTEALLYMILSWLRRSNIAMGGLLRIQSNCIIILSFNICWIIC